MTPHFGEIVVKTLHSKAHYGDWLEWGPGRGDLAIQVIRYLRQHDLPIQRYFAELNPHRRHDQAVLMREALGEDAKYVHWVDEVPDGFKGYILAHEIIDALPAKRVGYLNGRYVEYGFFWQDGLKEKSIPADRLLSEKMAYLEIPKIEGYKTEIRDEALKSWLQQHNPADEALMLLMDYGYDRRTFYHPDRTDGTLRTYKHHQEVGLSDNDFGGHDISISVEWDLVGEQLMACGWQPIELQTQAQWLSGHWSDKKGMTVSGLKVLVNTEMGELMKVALASNFIA